LSLAACRTVRTAETHVSPDVSAGRFERLCALEGTWVAQPGGDAPEGAQVVYRRTADGSTLQETVFAGAPHEMVTMIHRDGDDLVLTHYCAAGNQPHMRAQPSEDEGSVEFVCEGGTNFDCSRDGHMHRGVYTFVGPDRLRSVWTFHEEGRPAGSVRTELVRAR
jgi:hypothetical protein